MGDGWIEGWGKRVVKMEPVEELSMERGEKMRWLEKGEPVKGRLSHCVYIAVPAQGNSPDEATPTLADQHSSSRIGRLNDLHAVLRAVPGGSLRSLSRNSSWRSDLKAAPPGRLLHG
jgi:hypothetical protein